MNRFTIFDVETANHNPDSICSIGIIVVEDSTIIKEYYQLIQPNTYFDRRNTQIHGITSQDVEDAPTFADIWPEIRGFFEDSLVLAHYAAFDIGCLRAELRRYALSCASFPYSCTCVLGRKVLPSLPNHKLNTLAHYYGFSFNHHNALEDARTTALIAIQYLHTIPTTDMTVLHSYYQVKVKQFIQDISLRRKQTAPVKAYHLLYRKRICIGGTLSLPIPQLQERLYAIGAMFDTILDPATDLLVTGLHSEQSVPLQTIQALPSAYRAEIIDETLFLQMLDFGSEEVPSIELSYSELAPTVQVTCAMLIYNDQQEILLVQDTNSLWKLPYAPFLPATSLEETIQTRVQDTAGLTVSAHLNTVLSGSAYQTKEPGGALLSHVLTIYQADVVAAQKQAPLPCYYFALSDLPALDQVTQLILNWLQQKT